MHENVRKLLDQHPEVFDLELCERSLVDFIKTFWRWCDPSTYVHGRHIDAICEGLEAVSRGQCRRLLINIPPRHMKSIAVSVMWPCWTWGPLNRPDIRWLYASYAFSLSMRDSVRTRRIIDNPIYQAWWGDRVKFTEDVNTKQRFENTRGGYRLATSVDGALTGEGGDIIVVDDPHNVREAESEPVREAVLTWWDEAMSTRLNDPKTGAYVVIMQRVHERDLSGHILEQGGWEHIMLPARYEPDHPCFVHLPPTWADRITEWRTDPGELLWPERFGEPEIKSLEATLGSYGSAGQLQQRPAPREGGMFSDGWFEIVRAAPVRANRVRFWDMASTKDMGTNDPDYTVGVLMAEAEGIFYVEDVRRMRGTPLEIERLIKQTAIGDGKHVHIYIEQEGGASGKIVIDHYRRTVLKGFTFRGDPPGTAKEIRAEPVSAASEAGNVKLVKAEWNRAFLDEVGNFPNARHDDQVDAFSGAFAKLVQPRGRPNIRQL